MSSLYTSKAKNLFITKVIADNETGCHVWQGAASKNGYGCLSNRGVTESAHRASLEIHTNKRIAKGLLVRHKCDNKLCVNPAHLEIGSNKDNTKDMISRGRDKFSFGNRIGQYNNNAKLDNTDVAEIKVMLSNRVTNKKIAETKGVTHSMISRIKLRKNWAHL